VKGLGWVTTALLTLAVVGLVIIVIRSIPDMRRYAKMRQM
jgi:hypothetical protein